MIFFKFFSFLFLCINFNFWFWLFGYCLCVLFLVYLWDYLSSWLSQTACSWFWWFFEKFFLFLLGWLQPCISLFPVIYFHLVYVLLFVLYFSDILLSCKCVLSLISLWRHSKLSVFLSANLSLSCKYEHVVPSFLTIYNKAFNFLLYFFTNQVIIY